MQRRAGTSKSSWTTSSSPGDKSASSSSFFLFAWYARQLEQRPLLTKAWTSGLVSGTGDFICQMQANNNNNNSGSKGDEITMTPLSWDYMRTCRFCIMGSFWVAPITHVWYNALATKLLPGARTWTKVLQRLGVDQFGFAPLFVPSFMGVLWTLEGRDKIIEPLLAVAPEMIIANWSLWIPAMAMNFALVPLQYQVLFSNIVALCWNVYLSWMNATTKDNATTTTTTTMTTHDSSPPVITNNDNNSGA